MSTFAEATEGYERWRATRIPVLSADLARKHERLSESPFVLLRGSYYRFLQELPSQAPDAADAPVTIVVGDLHIENFGTWRDHEARLAWGINDYDEIDLLPYTVDLVRLATSALLAIHSEHLAASAHDACNAILQGWRERIERGVAETFVLGEHHRHLYALASEAFADPTEFERKIDQLAPFEGPMPDPAARLLAQIVAWPGWKPSLRRRTAGVGSLGSRRIVAAGNLDGGLLVQEAKEIPGPAGLWALPSHKRADDLAGAVAAARGAAADPRRRQSASWVLRPLAPDVARLELASLERRHDEDAILRSMGAEAGNVHLTPKAGAAAPRALARDADARPDGWLHDAATAMVALTERDYGEWVGRK